MEIEMKQPFYRSNIFVLSVLGIILALFVSACLGDDSPVAEPLNEVQMAQTQIAGTQQAVSVEQTVTALWAGSGLQPGSTPVNETPVPVSAASATPVVLPSQTVVSNDVVCDEVGNAVGPQWLYEATDVQDGRADICDPNSLTLEKFLTMDGSPYRSHVRVRFGNGDTISSSMFSSMSSYVSIHCSHGYAPLHPALGIDEAWWGMNFQVAEIIGKQLPSAPSGGGCMIVEWDSREFRAQAQKEWVTIRDLLQH